MKSKEEETSKETNAERVANPKESIEDLALVTIGDHVNTAGRKPSIALVVRRWKNLVRNEYKRLLENREAETKINEQPA